MWTLEQAFNCPSSKIISMTDDEDAYLFSMQFMLGEKTVIPFQKFHDDAWNERATRGKRESLRQWIGPDVIYFCTDSGLMDYMIDFAGDRRYQKAQREKKHWSQVGHQGQFDEMFIL